MLMHLLTFFLLQGFLSNDCPSVPERYKCTIFLPSVTCLTCVAGDRVQNRPLSVHAAVGVTDTRHRHTQRKTEGQKHKQTQGLAL